MPAWPPRRSGPDGGREGPGSGADAALILWSPLGTGRRFWSPSHMLGDNARAEAHVAIVECGKLPGSETFVGCVEFYAR